MVSKLLTYLGLVVLEEAPISIWTKSLGEELFALFRFVLLVLRFLEKEFMLAMSKLAFRAIPAYPHLNPVLA